METNILEGIEEFGCRVAQNEGQERFVIDCDSKAEWAINKIAEEEQEARRLSELCNEQIRRYATRKAEIEDRLNRRVNGLKVLLEEYFDSGIKLKTTDAGRKSYELASGRLIRKPSGVSYCRDDAALIKWCKTNAPKYVKTIINEMPDWKGLKKKGVVASSDGSVYITDTGEVIDGVQAVFAAPKFEVEVK